VDLPTYTNIWRIEKRLYKLYDFRLPMPLPINWIAVFAGIMIPYIILLIAIGLPFNHTLVWLYILPPGVLTWLTTRPVIENKRLPELVESQTRYLAEPRTWVRLTPLSEKDQMVLTARVWRSRRVVKRPEPAERPMPVARPALPSAEPGRLVSPLRPGPVLKPTSVFRPEPVQAIVQGQAIRQRQGSAAPQQPRVRERARAQERSRVQERARVQERPQAQERPQVQAWPGIPVLGQRTTRRAPALPPVRAVPPIVPVVLAVAPERSGLPVHAMPDVVPPAAVIVLPSAPAPASRPAPAASAPAAPAPAPPADQPAPVIVPVPPATPAPGPVRVRAGRSGEARLEVSHDGPRRGRGAGSATPSQPVQPVRPVRPAWPSPTALRQPSVQQEPVPSVQQEPVPQGPATPPTSPVPPADPARDWPVPARPLRPVPSLTDKGDTVTAEESPAAAVAPPADAPPADAMPAVAPPAVAPPAPAMPVLAPLAQAEPVPAAPAPVTDTPVAPAPVAVTPAEVPAEAPVEPVDQPPVQAALVEAVLAPPAPVKEPVPDPEPAQPPLAPAPAPAVQQVTGVKQQAVPSIERALSGPSRDLNGSWGGKVKVVTGNGAAQGPGARDQEAQDRNRARLPLGEPHRILILGCTSGAGQSVTALMTASMLASLREHPVAAVDLHDGTLARYRAPAAWLEELLAGKPPQQIKSARPDGLHPTPKPSPARLDVVASHEPLRDGDEIKLAVQLNQHYPLTLLDPGAASLTRLLKVTDQLVVVVPANVDAASALADTRDWLDNNGHADLAMQSVTVINGVSRRSLPDVESAESIARGRSRAIVRVPWDDMLPVAAADPSTLRPQTRVAYTALAGVLVAGLAAVPVRKRTP
jgi:hypothetical protein